MQTMNIPATMPIGVLSPKTVRKIPAKPEFTSTATVKKTLRTAAYCRVSTKKDEQHLSYESQKDVYTEKIMKNPDWQFVDIYADKGITGTMATKRPDFMRMIRDCKKRKIDLIITKSNTRFARNTLDCLEYVRLLKGMGIGVYFEIQNINTLTMTNEMILTMYAGMAQNESENLSANIEWGWQRSHAKGNVHFSFETFLGYREGADGKPEIVPEEAAIVKRIYTDFLMGQTRQQIADALTAAGVPTPMGKEIWQASTVHSILRNEKYMGDALLGKTYVPDCLTHKALVNNGERPQWYVENNHPAIIDKGTWHRAQEELTRRGSKRKVRDKGVKTEQGKYSSKFALTELMFCGECGTPYRRCTWSKNGKKKTVWRCVSRLDHGKKYCKESPTLDESILQDAILEATAHFAQQNPAALEVLKQHIGIGLSGESGGDDPYTIQARINEIDQERDRLYDLIAQPDNTDGYESEFEALYGEKAVLKDKLTAIKTAANHASAEQSRLDELFTVTDGIRNRPLIWDETLIRQMVECVRVQSKNKIAIRTELEYFPYDIREGITADRLLPKLREKYGEIQFHYGGPFAPKPGTSRFYMDAAQIAAQYGYRAEVSPEFEAAFDILNDKGKRICAVSKRVGIYPDSFTTLPKNEAFSEMMDEIRDTMEYFDLQEHEGHFDHANVREPSIITYFEQAAKMVRDAGFTARLDVNSDEILEICNGYGRHVAMVDGYSGSLIYNGLMPNDLRDAFQNSRLMIPFDNDTERESQRLIALQEQQQADDLITENNIEIDERELYIEDDHINALVTAWLDVDNRFGTETHGTDDYINVYANYYPETRELEFGYTLIKADGSDCDFKAVELADSEKEAVLAKMKEAGLDGCIAEMQSNPDEDEGMKLL